MHTHTHTHADTSADISKLKTKAAPFLGVLLKTRQEEKGYESPSENKTTAPALNLV